MFGALSTPEALAQHAADEKAKDSIMQACMGDSSALPTPQPRQRSEGGEAASMAEAEGRRTSQRTSRASSPSRASTPPAREQMRGRRVVGSASQSFATADTAAQLDMICGGGRRQSLFVPARRRPSAAFPPSAPPASPQQLERRSPLSPPRSSGGQEEKLPVPPPRPTLGAGGAEACSAVMEGEEEALAAVMERAASAAATAAPVPAHASPASAAAAETELERALRMSMGQATPRAEEDGRPLPTREAFVKGTGASETAPDAGGEPTDGNSARGETGEVTESMDELMRLFRAEKRYFPPSYDTMEAGDQTSFFKSWYHSCFLKRKHVRRFLSVNEVLRRGDLDCLEITLARNSPSKRLHKGKRDFAARRHNLYLASPEMQGRPESPMIELD